jgi:hypothetical protein
MEAQSEGEEPIQREDDDDCVQSDAIDTDGETTEGASAVKVDNEDEDCILTVLVTMVFGLSLEKKDTILENMLLFFFWIFFIGELVGGVEMAVAWDEEVNTFVV